jgi:hypothetical protein
MRTQRSWFSRFLQLVPGDGESQTTGKLCVLHLKLYPMRFRKEAKRGTVSSKAPRAAGINDVKRWFVLPE